MKRLILVSSLFIAACGGSSQNGKSNPPTKSGTPNIDAMANCKFGRSEYQAMAGHFENLEAATQAFMTSLSDFSLNNQCKMDADVLTSDLENYLTLEVQSDGQVDLKSRNGDVK